MDWVHETHVKLYVRVDGDWLKVPLLARGLFSELLKYANADGELGMVAGESPADAVARIGSAHKSDRAHLPRLLDALFADGCLQLRKEKGAIGVPNYPAAQGIVPLSREERTVERSKAAQRAARWREERKKTADANAEQRSDGVRERIPNAFANGTERVRERIPNAFANGTEQAFANAFASRARDAGAPPRGRAKDLPSLPSDPSEQVEAGSGTFRVTANGLPPPPPPADESVHADAVFAAIAAKRQWLGDIDDRELRTWTFELAETLRAGIPPGTSGVPYVRHALARLVDDVAAKPDMPKADRLRNLRRYADWKRADDQQAGFASARTDGREGPCAAPVGRHRGAGPMVATPEQVAHDEAERIRVDHECTERLRRDEESFARVDEFRQSGGFRMAKPFAPPPPMAMPPMIMQPTGTDGER